LYLLNTSQNKTLGPWKSIPVGQGDVITPEVWATYSSSNSSFNNTKLTAFITANPGYGTTGTGADTKLPAFPLTNISVGISQGLATSMC
jgi:hypothetical protein